MSLAQSDDIDVFVELIGGDEGPAKEATEAALKSGKDVVTANKAMLAHHGQALAHLAESNGLSVRYEAAVAGGIPIIKSLSEGLAGNQIKRVMGVMNGTCNYILTRMQSAGLSYDEVFAEADALGYLEADPNLDVGGIDAGHKLAILSAIAFGVQIDFDAVKLEGIGQISIEDINHAADMGYRIKLLGVSQMTENGLEQRMTPCLVPETSPLGQLEGGTNMVVVDGDEVGQIVLRGAGAGEGPTASAVMSDVLDLARGIRIPTFGQAADTLKSSSPAQCDTPAPYYLRMELLDRPGSLATVADALGQHNVSIHRMRQYDHDGDNAPVLIVTHATGQTELTHALADLRSLDAVVGTPVALRIEQI